MSHEFDIWQQLTRIADSLEKIERKLPEQPILTENGRREKNYADALKALREALHDYNPNDDEGEAKACRNCMFEDYESYQEPCISCGIDFSGYVRKEKTDE